MMICRLKTRTHRDEMITIAINYKYKTLTILLILENREADSTAITVIIQRNNIVGITFRKAFFQLINNKKMQIISVYSHLKQQIM